VRHEHPVQLRWSDPDSYGQVNHARALSLLEDALYYRVGEVLTVRSWVAQIGTKSVTVRQELITSRPTPAARSPTRSAPSGAATSRS